ncbi:glutamine-hydrolyzing carbamoyl-phosphate synthase small subunit [Buchnera aphidicola]|uniref:glutamine-hydrolyzing carbamoyl-phosphate synthase small subunit n=1 Tax=Buchnera aphidicola TaxID=9 RepID=UPI003463EE2A
MNKTAILMLQDGTTFFGKSIGIHGIKTGEIVFNTSMTGYQEILTDPSYKNQIITFTYPHIGNVGTNSDDEESSLIHAKGLIIREISQMSSNYRSQKTLLQYLLEKKILTITNIDTRKLTRKIREQGSQKGCIICLKKKITFKNYEEILKYKKENFLEKKKKTKEYIYQWKEKYSNSFIEDKKKIELINKKKNHIVVYNFGIKKNMLRMLKRRNCKITIVPKNTNYKDILKLSPNGIFLSNGHGDPRKNIKSINSIKKLLKYNIPMFGICLGHQILALANNAKIIKMKFGHHGANHPVQDVITKKIYITSQNHNFVIDKKSLPKKILITHISLFDQTIQGIKILQKPMFSFQGHPESHPGPHDIYFLFNKFIKKINKYQ